jgi:chloramphenicol 3-O-phosphotransferase
MTYEPASQLAKDARIWVICGNACAGKTTTARLLAHRLPLAAHVDGDEMQRLIVSGCRWAVPSDSDPGTGRLAGEAGAQYALRIRTACLVAAAFADAGITAIVTDTIINEGFESLTEVLSGRPVNFVVLRPPVTVLRKRGIERLPEEAEYLAGRYADSDHPEAAAFAGRVQAAADGRPVNEFEEIIERGLDRLPHVGLWVDPSRMDPQSVVDLLLDRRADAAWMVGTGTKSPGDGTAPDVSDERGRPGPVAGAVPGA